jgi:hypothetical protein
MTKLMLSKVLSSEMDPAKIRLIQREARKVFRKIHPLPIL